MDSPLKVLYMNRRLRLAAEPQTGRREVSALTDARKTLAYDFFRILRAPLVRPLARFLEQRAITPQPVGGKLFAAIVGAQIEVIRQPAQIVGVGLPYLDDPVLV